MSLIKIKIDSVEHTAAKVGQCSANVSDAKAKLSSASYSLDHRVSSRRNIDGRIRSAATTLTDVEKQVRNLESFLKKSTNQYLDAEKEIEGKNGWIQFGRDVALGLTAATIDPKTWFKKGLSFRLLKKDGVFFIKVRNGKVTSIQGFQKYYNMLKENLGGTSKWERRFVTRLSNDGIPLYDEKRNIFYRNNRNKFLNTQFDELNKYVSQIGEEKYKVFGRTLKDTAIDKLKVWNDFTGWKGATSASKVGKGLGILGTGLMVWGDAKDNFKDGFSGENLKNFGLDAAVDVGLGAGATAAGAAIGSLFLPPLGTVVGAGAGIAINAAITIKFGGPPAQSVVDHVKDFAKHPIKSTQAAVQKAKEIGHNIGEKASGALKSVGNAVSGIGKQLGNIFG